MKRAGNLFDKIIDYGNIRLAFLKAMRGKRQSPEALFFCRDVEANLMRVRARLSGAHIRWGIYRKFVITDPKERIISAAPFDDHVIHHAVMNVLGPIFERNLIYHTYACRKNKGSHAAVKFAFDKCRSNEWFLKLDVRKYFDSIDHDILKKQIECLIKDRRVLNLLGSVIDSYKSESKTLIETLSYAHGLPIGNLTSQYFANLYLSKLDHYILESLIPRAYVRYMDDFVLWTNDKDELKVFYILIRQFALRELNLELKPPLINGTAQGLPFLGFMVKNSGIFLLNKSKRRVMKRVKTIRREFLACEIGEAEAGARITSVYAAIALARTRAFRAKLLRNFDE